MLPLLIKILAGVFVLLGIGTLVSAWQTKNPWQALAALIYAAGGAAAYQMETWVPLAVAFGIALLLRFSGVDRA